MSEPQNLSGGQRLRWWQEETTPPPVATTPQRWYTAAPESRHETTIPTMAPVVASAPLDLEEELEAEARRRAGLEKDAVHLVGDPARIVRRNRKRMAWCLLPAALIQLPLVFLGNPWLHLSLMLILLIEFFVLDKIVRSAIQSSPPGLSLSSLGLTWHAPRHRVGPIFWSEIKSVRVRRTLGNRFVEITLKDPQTTVARAFHWLTPEKRGMEKAIRRRLEKGKLVIHEMFLPVSADEAAAQIATFRPRDDVRTQ